MSPYQNHTDTELVTLLIQGDQMAFEAIYRKYASDLYKYARRNIPLKEDCEEIVQDIFTDLWTRHESLGHVTVLNAYLFRMVKYKVIRYFQHSAVKRKYEEHYKLFEAVYESSNEQERNPAAIKAMIEKGLAKLPERCRLAVMLRLTENLSNSDIAKRMNIKKRTVENYMVTAFNHLRSAYPDLHKAG
jgi:RNA polymerase sigma-70 factor (family 1)